jgi:hypothetical protein
LNSQTKSSRIKGAGLSAVLADDRPINTVQANDGNGSI